MAKSARKKQKDKTDKAFSLYIRARDGYRCVICGAHGTPDRFGRPLVGLDCGHVHSGRGEGTRWDERNAFCQCKPCNIKHEHDPWPLFSHCINVHGVEVFHELHVLAFKVVKRSVHELELIEQGYKQRAEEYL